MKKTGLFLVLIFFGFRCSVSCQSNEPSIYNDNDSYDVYSSVLSLPSGISNLPRSKLLLIRQDTLSSFGAFVDQKPDTTTCLKPTDEFKPIVGPAIEDLLLKNKTKWRLRKQFDIETPYKLVSSEQILELIKTQGWAGFNKAYPDSGAFIDLSAVGFNLDKSIAVLHKGGWCGELCGEGAYYVMQKKQGKWVPLDQWAIGCSWVS